MKEEQTINGIPKNWKWVKLQDIVSVLGDGLHGTPIYSEDGEYYFINGNNLSNDKIIIKENTKRVCEEQFAKHKKNLTDKTILVSINGTIGNVAFYKNEKVILGKSACYFNVKDDINKYFIALLLKTETFLRYANNSATGSTIKNVSLKAMREFEFPLPPLELQTQIVSKIEELFSELDKGIEELKTAQQQLKVYRQAVLKWAFEGKLTNENVKDGELPEGWKWKTLGELCDPQRKCSYGVLVPGDHVENGVTLVRVGDIDDNGRIDQSKLKKISPQIASKFKRTFLQGGEVLISLVGAIGRTAVVPVSLAGANTARAVGVIPISKDVSAKFVEAMLRSPDKIREHNNSSHEVARKTLNLEDVIKSNIPLPPIEEQQQIVQEIESRLSVCDKIEETITDSLKQAEALRQSILKKAFEGTLINSDNL
ncbi:restriction endonuclease subunit S [Paracnuella aquatica]|uniref:restriction endonuclease subunit S n=1 Tax=Paracnuella aquatica TaxID=2268757 RepID=UPI000DEF55FA|nr:restriction endonuclease subunit S [Paracnuella aquatica]RPD51084.1 hypothetical protein DRJ53_06235 [Paracnuella aquatica]